MNGQVTGGVTEILEDDEEIAEWNDEIEEPNLDPDLKYNLNPDAEP